MTTSTDQQDVVEILTSDHHEVLEMVAQIPAADAGTRRDLADTVVASLAKA